MSYTPFSIVQIVMGANMGCVFENAANMEGPFTALSVAHHQACKLKFKLIELISCFCCVHTSHMALEADSRGSSGT